MPPANRSCRVHATPLHALIIIAVICVGSLPTRCSALDIIGAPAATEVTNSSLAAEKYSATAAAAAALANSTQSNVSQTGNELWDGLVNECMAKPTSSCLQKNFFHYLHVTLSGSDVNVTSGIRFVRNQLDGASLRATAVDDGADAADEAEDTDEGRSGEYISKGAIVGHRRFHGAITKPNMCVNV